MRLPINISDLLQRKVVESERIEFKLGWNPAPIMRTICAFANDFQNLGGGYVIVGIEEANGQPVMPPKGVPTGQLDTIQKELLQFSHLLQPHYFPILSIETYQEQTVLVIWVPGGLDRPYKVPKDVCGPNKEYRYYIRRYSSTVIAKDREIQELVESTRIPFDDRINHRASVEDLSLSLIKSFLKEVNSALVEEVDQLSFTEFCRQMALVEGGSEFLKPRNVGLLFFNDKPDQFFPQTQIDIVQFPDGLGGDVFKEKIFKGPLHKMLREALEYLNVILIEETIVKHPDRAEADRFYNYPFSALEEALVNAVYHRSYETREPIEVRILPDQVTIASYPGPEASISLKDLKAGRFLARRYRNRRIGEFLKELKLTEGRGTGIPKIKREIKKNSSPMPKFHTDENRSYFVVEFPIKKVKVSDEAPVKTPVKAPVEFSGIALNTTEFKILNLCEKGIIGRKNILSHLGYKSMSGNVKQALKRLKENQFITYTIPDKPKSRNQQYTITERGRLFLKQKQND